MPHIEGIIYMKSACQRGKKGNIFIEVLGIIQRKLDMKSIEPPQDTHAHKSYFCFILCSTSVGNSGSIQMEQPNSNMH